MLLLFTLSSPLLTLDFLIMQTAGVMLDGGHIKSMVDEFKQAITASCTRKRERAERAKTEDFDAEEGELLQEENAQEEEVFDQASRVTRLHLSKFILLSRLPDISHPLCFVADWGVSWDAHKDFQKSLFTLF